MLKKLFIGVMLINAGIIGLIHTSEKPFCIDWGCTIGSEIPHTLTYASGNLAYILFTPHQKQLPILNVIQRYVGHYLVPNIKHLQGIENLIDVWHPIERYIHRYAPTIHLAVTVLYNGTLCALLRGNCGLYHFKQMRCTIPVTAETMKTAYSKDSKQKNEFVSLCGIQQWDQGDRILICTPNIDRNIRPEKIYPNFIKCYEQCSASAQSLMLTLCTFSPEIPLKTEAQCNSAAKHIEKDSACIIINNKRLHNKRFH